MSENKSLSLYDRESEWRKLEEMLAEPFENETPDLVALVETTYLALQEKRDSFCNFLAFLEAQEDFANGEIERLGDRKKRIAAARKRLEKIAIGVIQSFGKEDDGVWKKIEGATSSLQLDKNPPSVEITDDRAVPSEYKSYEIAMKVPASRWEMLSKIMVALDFQLSKDPIVSIDLKRVAKELKRMVPCEACGAIGVVENGNVPFDICSVCNGEKQVPAVVPGARLVTDRVRLVRK